MTLELILLIAAGALFLVTMIIYRRDLMKQWLLTAVSIAEQELGSKKGQQKLALVKAGFAKRFPIVSRFIPDSVFNKLVDTALDILKNTLK